ncbi:MAG: beta-ketoacyl synthase chain length factor [Candidatus Omnitrophica bacterium]|nr:beta-ketoacyl synthase chain length factor [Candidatus Omnitrophota bacterium]
MNIQGIGILSGTGRGIKSFEQALERGPATPKVSMYSPATNKEIPVFSIDNALLKDPLVLKSSRRADRFCRMAVLAAWDALADSGIKIREEEKLGVIVATAFGPHKTTFNFLDNILDYGDAAVSPTIFSHSVHNAAASYITSALNTQGPVSTLTDFCFPFHEALRLAEAWINQGRCQYVLIGTVDELSPAMEYICDQKCDINEEGKMKPFEFSDKAQTVPGEGSVFFLLSKNEENTKYCRIKRKNEAAVADMFILESDGMITDETVYKQLDTGDANLFNASPIFGGMMSSTGFHCASAALMLKNDRIYSKFAQDQNSHARNSPDNIVSVKYCCNRNKAIVRLTK